MLFTTGFAANLGVITTFAGLRRARVLRRAEPRVDHRRPPALGRSARGLPPSRRRPRRRDPARPRTSRARSSSRRRCSRWTATSRRSRELAEVCARHGALLVLDEAHAVLQPDVGLRDDVDVLRVGTLSKTLGALGGFVAGPARYTDLVVNRARSYIFTTASTPADTAAALAALAVLRSPEGDDAAGAPARQHRPAAAEPPVADRALRLRVGAPRDRGRGGAARRRPARHRHPPADRAARHVAAARHDVGRAHARAGRPARARARVALPRMTRPDTLVFVAGTGTEVGKTWWTAAVARELRARRRDRRGAQAGAVGGARRTARRRRARRRHRRRPRTPCAPRTAPTTSRGHRRWPPTSWGCRRSPSRTSRPSSVWPDGVAVGLVEGVGGPRSPIAADGDNVDFARATPPDLVVLVGDAGLGTINAVRLSVGGVRRLPGDRGPEPLRRRPAARAATATSSSNDAGLDVVTAPLAARGARHCSSVDRS